ncbi:MAG TPA: dockerin type I domain-containing protein [Pirellulales bacterium]
MARRAAGSFAQQHGVWINKPAKRRARCRARALRLESLEERYLFDAASSQIIATPTAAPGDSVVNASSASITSITAAGSGAATAGASSASDQDASSGGAEPLVNLSSPFKPAQIAMVYGFNNIFFPPNGPSGPTKGDGTGQTIAIVDPWNQPNIVSDLKAFDHAFGLPDPQLTVVNQNGNASPLPSNAPKTGDNANAGIEISLDVEWAHALAPGANILLVEATDNSFSNLDVAVSTAVHSGIGTLSSLPAASVVSMSYGAIETFSQNDPALYSTPSGKVGVTFIASSGDSGGAGEYPATDPNVLGVGGTTLSIAADGTYAGEVAWIDSNGGPSPNPQFSYQHGVQPSGGSNPGLRMAPDVSFDANNASGVYVYDTYDGSISQPWFNVGGTSLGSPSWAALVAIADQARGTAGALPGLTTLNDLYALYSNGSYAYDFLDVTSGTNTGGLSAGPGYDYVTGLGSPRANTIVSALAGISEVPTPTAPSGTVSTTTPTFQWSSVPDATGYFLTIVDTTTQTTIANGISVTGTSYTPAAGLATGDSFQWKVQAFDGAGALAAASSPLSFTVMSINHAPTGTNNTITEFQGTPYQFAASDFGFSDPNDNPPNSLLAVEITTVPVPTVGTLADNGVAVTAGQLVSATDIAAGLLTFTSSAGASGSPYTSFMFQVEDNGGTANGGINLDPLPKSMTINVVVPPRVAAVVVDGSTWAPTFQSALQNAGLGATGYQIPVGSSAQLQPLPWNTLNQIQITFNENVNVSENSLVVTGVSVGQYAFNGFSYSNTTHTAIWTLASPIGTDRLTLDLVSTGVNAVTDSLGNPLDGDWTNGTSVFPSGNGSPGGDFRFGVNILPGDTSPDGVVNGLDINQIASHWLSVGGLAGDINGDGIVNGLDINVIASQWLKTLPAGGGSGSGAGAGDIDTVGTGNATIDNINGAAASAAVIQVAQNDANGSVLAAARADVAALSVASANVTSAVASSPAQLLFELAPSFASPQALDRTASFIGKLDAPQFAASIDHVLSQKSVSGGLAGLSTLSSAAHQSGKSVPNSSKWPVADAGTAMFGQLLASSVDEDLLDVLAADGRFRSA